MELRSLSSVLCVVMTLAMATACVAQPTRGRNQYDIVIYGGTAGGVGAAIQAARMGKKVALVEPTAHVGGIVVEGLGGTDIDNHREFQNSVAVGGLALEFYRRIAHAYDRVNEFETALRNREKKPELWRFEPHVAEGITNQWLEESGVEVFRNARLKETSEAMAMEAGRITAIFTEDGNSFTGKVFVDASIEGDLLYRAGVSTVVGRESNDTYDETLNGIRGHTSHNQFKIDVDPYVVPGNPESGVIPTILDEPLGTPGAGDHRLQAYCFRVCMTKDPANRISFKKPEGYDRGEYEIYLRYMKAGGKLYRPSAHLPNGKTDLNGGADLSHNLYGMNYGYPEGSYAERQEIYDYHRRFTLGLFYFLSNDLSVRELDAEFQQEWAQWGLPKDEFTDNDHWPRQFYVRDARRMVSDYVITEHHARKAGGTPVEDPVAMAFWPPDVHSVRRIVKDGKAYNEGFVFGGEWWKPFGISYRALVPKLSECKNLLTPTCPSSSHIAYGGIRIEWTFMALGQAVGTAAALAIDDRCSVQEVDYNKLKRRLLKDGQIF